MKNEIILLGTQLVKDIEKLDRIIDEYIDPIKDITDTGQDILMPLKVINSLFEYNKKRKFKKFLISFAKSINDRKRESLEHERLEGYFKNEKNLNYFNDLIEKAIQSNSVYSSIILGYYAGLILSDEIEIKPKEIITLQALKELSDFELSCFTRIYACVNLAEEVDISKYKQLNGIQFLAELTIQKMIQVRMVEDPPERYGNSKNGRFLSTDIAEEIHSIIQLAGIEDELLNYQF